MQKENAYHFLSMLEFKGRSDHDGKDKTVS